MSKIELIHGDCLKEMKNIPDGSVDLILTDPPYGTTACKWDNIIPFEPMWAEIWRVLKPNGACVLFGSEPFSSALRMSQIKYFKYDWVWVKTRKSGQLLAKKRPMLGHEIISIFNKKQPTYFPYTDEVNPLAGKKASPTGTEVYSGDKIKNQSTYTRPLYMTKISTLSGYDVGKERGAHPTQKPVAILEYLIKTYTLENETVLDFTMGSGSTGVACQNTNRNFIGIEQEEKYFKIAQTRMDIQPIENITGFQKLMQILKRG